MDVLWPAMPPDLREREKRKRGLMCDRDFPALAAGNRLRIDAQERGHACLRAALFALASVVGGGHEAIPMVTRS